MEGLAQLESSYNFESVEDFDNKLIVLCKVFGFYSRSTASLPNISMAAYFLAKISGVDKYRRFVARGK